MKTMKTMKIFKHTHKVATIGLVSLMIFACSSDDDVDETLDPTDPTEEIVEPIILDCGIFSESEVHLTDDPNAPVDYIMNCDPEVNGNLTIDPGVVIAFKSDAGMRIGKYGNGKVQMKGTAEKPIVLTGVNKSKGSWRGIQISSDNTANVMEYVTVEYAGQTGRGGWALQGSVIGTVGGTMKMDHCTIQHGNLIGLHWVGGSLNAGDLTLSNSTLTGNDTPVVTNINHVSSIDGSNSYTGNTNDYIELKNGGGAYRDVTFYKTDVPYFTNGFGPDNAEKRRFTFKPGVTMLMEAGSLIRFQNAFHYNHEIIMVGTEDEPITIKGKEDVAGYWTGIKIDYTTNPLNEIAFVDIANAGVTTGNPNGAVHIASSDVYLNMHDVNFIDCFEYAVSIERPTAINFSYSNLNLINTPKLFSDWSGSELVNP